MRVCRPMYVSQAQTHVQLKRSKRSLNCRRERNPGCVYGKAAFGLGGSRRRRIIEGDSLFLEEMLKWDKPIPESVFCCRCDCPVNVKEEERERGC